MRDGLGRMQDLERTAMRTKTRRTRRSRAGRAIGVVLAAWLATPAAVAQENEPELPKRCVVHGAPEGGAPLFVAFAGFEKAQLPDEMQVEGLVRSVEITARNCLAQLFPVDAESKDVSISGFRTSELLPSHIGPYGAISCTCFD